MRGATACGLTLATILVLGSPLPARAQASPPAAAATDAAPVAFLTAYHGRIGAARFTVDDEQFTWEGRFAGDVDLVDYGSGRLNFAAEYAVVLGSERRSFDPTQGFYALDFRATRRFGTIEVGGVFHHVSRHLSDRAKTDAIDWNMLGAEVLAQSEMSGFRLESRLHASGVIKHSYVDYTWRSGVGLGLERDLSPRVTFIGQGAVDFLGIDAAIAGRSSQVGAYVEGGVRLRGEAAALELFVAFERRVDPDPLERTVRNWGLVGFRLLNR